MLKDSYTQGYLKGYEDGMNEAWSDVIKLTTKGLTSREIAIRAKAIMGTIYQKLDGKRIELSKHETVMPAQPQASEIKEHPVFATPVEGGCYIIRESRPYKSLNIFSSVASRTQKGLCIARTEMSTIKNSVRGSNITFISLSRLDEAKNHENCIPPDLSRVQSVIKEFMDSNKNGIILLEGIHYLINQTEFNRVLRFIQSIRDDVSAKKFSLIVPIDPEIMDTREYKQLEAELQVI
jgi:hypothetical protein